MAQITYLVTNVYKGCRAESYFTDKAKFRAYCKRQAARGHTRIAWCRVNLHPEGMTYLIGLVP